jgi:hypothetical protein
MEYIMTALLQNRWVSHEKFGHVKSHCTHGLSIPALSKVPYSQNDYIILHFTNTELIPCVDIS